MTLRPVRPGGMPVDNSGIAAIFGEIADLLEIQDANPFRVRAYRNAARELESLGVSAAELVAKGADLTELPAIGADLAAKIKEIVETGRCSALEKLRAKLPPTLTVLLKVPGLGPKRVKSLYDGLEVQTLDQLRRAARAGRIRALPGFGEKTEKAILAAIEAHADQGGRFEFAVAARHAKRLTGYLKKIPGVERVVAAGSYRRRKETVGDLDILVTAANSAAVMDALTAYDPVRDVLAKGSTRSSVRLRSGLQVDLRVVEEQSFGSALLYFTGSKAHNIALRRLAQKRKLKINEYGVFKGRKRIAGETEESVYAALGLRWIDPPLREGRGEIEAARAEPGTRDNARRPKT